MIFKSEATKTFINDDQEFLQELLSKENERSDTESDDSFVEEDDSTSGGQYEETVKIRELGTDVMDFESQFVKGEDKIVRAEQAINELSETEKQALFEKLGLQSHIGAYAGIVNWVNGKHFVTYNGVICKIKANINPRYGYYLLRLQSF